MQKLLGLGGRVLALVVIVGGGVLFGGTLLAVRTAQSEQQVEPLTVGVVQAEEQDTFIAQRKFAGRIVPRRTSDLSFELGGLVVALEADDGDAVQAEQALARLDTEQLQNRRNELAAQKVEVEAQLRRAQSTLQRTEELVARGFSTEQDLDNIRAERDGARARLSRIEASIAGVDTDLDNTILTAPFSGQIIRRYVDEGSVVQAGSPILRLNEFGVPEARIGIPTTFLNKVQVGETYQVTAGALSAEGVVTSIVSDVNTQTGTLTVILEIPDDPGFVARDLVRLSLQEEIRETGLWVPAGALNESLRGLWAVFVVEPDDNGIGTVVRKDVEIVQIEERRVYVRGTLEDGDLVVASSAFRLVPGQRVRIVRDTDQ